MRRRISHLLARLLPADLRSEHGPEIARDIDRRFDEGRGWSTLADVAAAVVRERRRPASLLPAPAPRRSSQVTMMMQTFFQDLRFALRMFGRQPAFTAAAVLTLGLGIGSSTAVISLADATLLRPIAAHEPNRLAQVPWGLSYPDFREMQRRAEGFEGVLGYANLGGLSLDRGGSTERVPGTLVSGNYFEVLGIAPGAGRLLNASDELSGAAPSIVISHRLWQSSFGRSLSAVGEAVRVNGRSAVIVGVAPEGFRGLSLGNIGDVWMPLALAPQLATGFLGNPRILEPNFSWIRVVGRLRPDVTFAQASERLELLYNELHPPRAGADREPLVLGSVATTAVGGGGSRADLAQFITLLFAVAAVLLVLGCANVANLLLARASARRQEVGVRIALGAGRGRLLAQLLAESALLGAAGAAAGLVIAMSGLSVLGQYRLPGNLLIDDLALGINTAVFTAALALTAVAVLIFGLVPAILTSRRDVNSVLREGGRTATRTPLGRALVMLQVALCVSMVGGGLLFARGLQRGLGFDLGYRTDGVVMMTADPSLERLPAERASQYLIDALAALDASGPLRSAGVSVIRPMRGAMSVDFRPSGYTSSNADDFDIPLNLVSEGWFETLGITLVGGRTFTEEDRGPVKTAVVSESLARKYWPGREALGQQIVMGDDTDDPVVTVVGIVRDARYGAVDAEAGPYLYLPLRSDFGGLFRSQLHVFAKSDLPPGAALAAVRQALQSADARVPLFGAMTLEDHVADALMPQRLGLVLLIAFSVAALVLASAGVYAIAAYSVTARRREIGIRMALGADRGRVLRQVMRDGALPVLAGAVGGIAVQLWASKLAESFVFGIDGRALWQAAAAAAVVIAAALVALALPARAAAGIEPTVALRE